MTIPVTCTGKTATTNAVGTLNSLQFQGQAGDGLFVNQLDSASAAGFTVGTTYTLTLTPAA